MKRLLLFVFLGSFTTALYAQLSPSVSNPVSPEVSSLGKYVDFPVGTYSGVPEISIPLFEVNYKSISIPISLSYHASGIKVNQEASWVGLGWDLFSGGFITKSIIGNKYESDDSQFAALPGYQDFKGRFYHGAYGGVYETVAGVGFPCGNSGMNGNEHTFISNMNGLGLGSPDVFTFSFPGGSGKFVLDPETQQPMILKKEGEFRIEPIGIYGAGWKIKTPDGNEYTFDKIGQGYPLHTGEYPTSKTWKLTKVKSPDGSEVIFQYTKAEYVESIDFRETLKSEVGSLYPTDPYFKYPAESAIEDFYLTKIITPKEVVEFVLEPRVDLKGKTLPDGSSSVQRLKEIIIKDAISSKSKKGYKFGYSYFDAAETGNHFRAINSGNHDIYCKRLKLNDVTEIGYDAIGNPKFSKPFEFNYNESIPMPSKVSYAQDYWGYYNGQVSNTTLLPDLLPLHIFLSDFNTIPFSIVRSTYRANRGPSISHMQVGLLTKITYPTGGSRNFEFEPHTFDNLNFFDASQIASSNATYYSYDNNKTGDPTYLNIGTIPREMYVNVDVNFNGGIQQVPFDNMVGSYVYLKKQVNGGTPQIIKTWSLTADLRNLYEENFRINFNDDVLLTPGAGIQFFIETILPNALGAQASPSQNANVGATVKYFSFTVTGAPKNYGSGVRIKKIELTNSNDEVELRRTYDYLSNLNTTGKLLSLPTFLSKRYETHKKLRWVGICPNVTYVIDTEIHNQFINNSSSNISLSLSPNSGFVGYSSVTVNENSSLTSSINSKTRYEFINNENIYGADYPEDPKLDNGLLLKVKYMDNTGSAIRETAYTYELFATFNKSVTGYTIEDLYTGPDECVVNPCTGVTLLFNPLGYLGRWKIRSYPIRSQWHFLTSKTETSISGGNSLSEVTSYEYNSLGMLKKELTIASNGDVLSKEYKYPVDYTTSPPYPLVTTMNTAYYQPEIESSTLHNSNILRKSLTTYQTPATNQFIVQSENIQNTTGGIIDFINYTNSSPLTNNPKEFIGKDGVSTVVLWGRNGTVPIASILAVTLSQVNAKVNPVALETMTSASMLRTELLKLYTISGAQVELYFYDDKARLIELKDPTQTSMYFEYDPLGRLKLSRDKDNNILKTYEYHYKGQASN